MKFTYGSLFTGIGGFDAGMDRQGMECVWQVEKDKNCQRVLTRHFPSVPRFNDVTTFSAADAAIRRPRLIAGGFPCQDLSVAGKRAGLAGERSGLFHQFMRIVSEFSPQWVLIENVVGLLSSNQGRDMGTVVGTLGNIGYGWAYRVLDSQYFGLAQRRKRVFIVGYLADARRAAQVLFEPDCLPWDSPPSREERKDASYSLAPSLNASGRGTSRAGESRGQDCVIPTDTHTFQETGHGWWNDDPIGQSLRDQSLGGGSHANLVSHTLNGKHGKHGKRFDGESETFITHPLKAEGHDASEDGTGRGVPLIAQTLRSRQSSPGVSPPGRGGEDDANLIVTGTLNANGKAAGSATQQDAESNMLVIEPIPIDMRQASRGGKMTNNRRGGTSGGAPGTGIGDAGDPAPTLSDSHTPAVATEPFVAYGFDPGQSSNPKTTDQITVNGTPPLPAGQGAAGRISVSHGMNVRRLTPIECERLQGFPDGWTKFDDKGKAISDSARYKMLGNAVSVNVAEWLAMRIIKIDNLSPSS